MGQIPSALSPSSGQYLTAVPGAQPCQETKSSFSFYRRRLVRVTSGLESLLDEQRNEEKSVQRPRERVMRHRDCTDSPRSLHGELSLSGCGSHEQGEVASTNHSDLQR